MIKNQHPNILDELFNDFFRATSDTFQALEATYNVQGICEQIFGSNPFNEATAKDKLKNSAAWRTLVELYEYAIQGVEPTTWSTQDLPIAGSEVIKLASSENSWPSNTWDTIVSMGDGRFALDSGESVSPVKLALLANVDIRTVRNAMSSGDLVSYKDKLDAEIYIENASARQWLLGRRGFKPTVSSSSSSAINLVYTPAEFSAFLLEQRTQLDLQRDVSLPVQHHAVASDKLKELEEGVFSLPLDAVIPLADYYQVDRKKFLKCVMRVFFSKEMSLLAETGSSIE